MAKGDKYSRYPRNFEHSEIGKPPSEEKRRFEKERKGRDGQPRPKKREGILGTNKEKGEPESKSRDKQRSFLKVFDIVIHRPHQ
jgi:hypothetical protein